ncbi:MAG: FGGY-family carbohydrate kinase [Candidatus Binatia bacterium]
MEFRRSRCCRAWSIGSANAETRRRSSAPPCRWPAHRRRRPAGGDVRRAAHQRQAVKITFGTSAMIDINTGGSAGAVAESGAYPLILLEHRRPPSVLPRGHRRHRRRRGAVAARRPRAHRVGRRRGRWRRRCQTTAASGPCRRSSARHAAHGSRRARRHRQPVAYPQARAHRARDPRELAFRTAEVFENAARRRRHSPPPARLRVDGGVASNDVFMQALADCLGLPVENFESVQATALGAACLAGLGVGVWRGLDELRHAAQRSGGVFEPRRDAAQRAARRAAWQRAVHVARLGAGPRPA